MPHIHEKIDFVVAAFIVHRNKVLLINHRKAKKWLAIGGHIELNEDPEEALFREIKEESGLNRSSLVVLSSKPSFAEGFKPLYLPAFLDIHDFDSSHKHIGLAYIIKSKTGAIALNSKEHSDIRWFSEKEIIENKFPLIPQIKFYSLEALKKAKE